VSLELRIKQAKSISNGWNSEYREFPIDPGIGLWKSDISNILALEIRLQRWMLEVARVK